MYYCRLFSMEVEQKQYHSFFGYSCMYFHRSDAMIY